MEFHVPLAWSGAPFAEGSHPLSWLGADGSEIPNPDASSEPPTGALRVRFRTLPTMQESMRIERIADAILGGTRASVELDLQIQAQWGLLLAKYTRALWPDGRPEAQSPEEAEEQERAINALYANDLVDRFVLQRLRTQHENATVMAEWEVLIDHCPKGWEVLSTQRLHPARREALIATYLHHRARSEDVQGKPPRSVP